MQTDGKKELEEKPKKKKPRRRDYLRDIREYFLLDRLRMAEMLNISVFTLRNWEQGVSRPRLEGMRRMKKIFVDLAVADGMTRKEAVAFVSRRLFPEPQKDSDSR